MRGAIGGAVRVGLAVAIIALGAPAAWSQPELPSAGCGDGVVTAPETCDPPGSAVCDCCCGVCATHASDPACACCHGCRPDCTSCGDGIVNGAEQCDDGNTQDNDGCNSSCRVLCGDGVAVPGFETCDPPDAPPCDCCVGHDAGGGCSGATCNAAVCAIDPDCCTVKWSWDCADLAATLPACTCCQGECHSDCSYCGDGAQSPEETCEPPGSPSCNCCATSAGTGCSNPICTAAVCATNPACCQVAWGPACVAAAAAQPACSCCQQACGPHCITCGDGRVNGQETCDPPGADVCNCCSPHTGSGPACTDAGCWNRICNLDEYCCEVAWDAVCANLAEAEPACSCCNDCRQDCTFCGDGIVAALETCDPAQDACDCCGPRPSPGCSNMACTLAVCAHDPVCCAVGWDFICADEALATPECVACCGACRSDDCTMCGDWNLDPGEDCDDGNLRSGDGCEPNCRCTDRDFDLTCDSADNCPLTANPGNSVALFGQLVTAWGDKENFGWPAVADVDWVWGTLQQLKTYATSGGGSMHGVTDIPAPPMPLPGQVFYWLVRADCPQSSWKSGGQTECFGPPLCLPGGRDSHLPP